MLMRFRSDGNSPPGAAFVQCMKVQPLRTGWLHLDHTRRAVSYGGVAVGHDRVTPHDDGPGEDVDAVLVRHGRVHGRDRLVGPDRGDHGAGRDHVAGPHRGQEAPRHLEEDAAGSGQLLRHECVEEAGGDATLHDDSAEPRPGGELGVVVDRVAVAGDLREELDVARRDGTGAGRRGPDVQGCHAMTMPGPPSPDLPAGAPVRSGAGKGARRPVGERRGLSPPSTEVIVHEHHQVPARLTDGGTAMLRPLEPGEDGRTARGVRRPLRAVPGAPLPHGDEHAPALGRPRPDRRRRLPPRRLARDGGGRPAGIARYVRVPDGPADLAFEVVDAQQGRGLGSLLLDAVATLARANAVTRVSATVHPANGAVGAPPSPLRSGAAALRRGSRG